MDKGIFQKKVFVLEIHGEKKRSISLAIVAGRGFVSKYSQVDSVIAKGNKGYLLVHHSLLKQPTKVAEARRQCEIHNLTALNSEYIVHATAHGDGTVLPKFVISWDKYTDKETDKQSSGSKKSLAKRDGDSDSEVDDVTFRDGSPQHPLFSSFPYPITTTSPFAFLPPAPCCMPHQPPSFYPPSPSLTSNYCLHAGPEDSSSKVARKRPEEPIDDRDKSVKSPSAVPTPAKRHKPTPQLSPSEPYVESPTSSPTPTPATTRKRAKPTPQATPRRASERIRHQTPPRSVAKAPRTPAKRSATTDDETDDTDGSSESDHHAPTAPASSRKKPATVLAPRRSPRALTPTQALNSTITPKTTTKTIPKTPKTTIKAEPKTPKTTTKTSETPKTTTKTPKTASKIAPEDDPLQYIMRTLAHDAGLQVDVAGRESEFSQLCAFCEDCITTGKSGSAYLCGKPGTGKTLTVSTAINAVLKWAQKGKYIKPEVIKVNCTEVPDPKSIYRIILERSRRYSGGSIANAEKELESMLFSEGRMTLLVLDEIDQLMSHQSTILYRLFEWSSAANSNLILIGIANTLDLVQRSLPLLSKGAIAPVIIEYKPYSHAQLVSVITARTAIANVIDPVAIQFCAKKVASIDGDVRKALDICMDAAREKQIQIKSTGGSPRIDMGDMVAAIKRNYPVEVADQIKSLPLLYQVVLCGAVTLSHSFSQDELHTSYMAMCKKARIPSVGKSEFADAVSGLAGYNLLQKTQRAKIENISVPVTKEDLVDGMDSSLYALKSVLEQHCQPGR
eukprot:Phypoly_transcript_03054.p1 GENE.Phypoly_transcript_03054~~Phypoly_transcript_03054.p1  ORF type:complete len:788 (+),score=110.16 Phypoly_transcript_03054:88-2451(+)